MKRIYFDESVNVLIAEGVRKYHFEVFTAVSQGKLHLSDKDQLAYANELDAIIITEDLRFVKEVANIPHNGIIVVFPKRRRISEVIGEIVTLCETIPDFENGVFYV